MNLHLAHQISHHNANANNNNRRWSLPETTQTQSSLIHDYYSNLGNLNLECVIMEWGGVFGRFFLVRFLMLSLLCFLLFLPHFKVLAQRVDLGRPWPKLYASYPQTVNPLSIPTLVPMTRLSSSRSYNLSPCSCHVCLPLRDSKFHDFFLLSIV